MNQLQPYFINVNGQLVDVAVPRVMGILNVTPDSFFAESRKQTEKEIVCRAMQIAAEGATFIDIGAYSSRSNAQHISAEEEMSRLRFALDLIRRHLPQHPALSIDTFRADVARMCVEEYGAAIINDISAGDMDESMFATVAQLGVPYIIMHMQGTPQNMQVQPHYENVTKEVIVYLSERVDRLRQKGVKDVLLDPGFGFGKTLRHNYELLNNLEEFRIFGLPLLIGISRKSMIYKHLGGGPEDALNGTTALHMATLMKGANILRVHDVKEAVETVRLYEAITKNELLD